MATADTAQLLQAAMRTTQAVWKDAYRYKKAGVMLMELTPAATVQGDLWTAPIFDKAKALMRTIDQLNINHGRGTVRFATSGFQRGWKLRSEQRSPHYTTDWDDLLVVSS